MYCTKLTEVSVPAEDKSQQSSTFTHVHHGPVPKYHTQGYTKHKQKIRHNNKTTLAVLIVLPISPTRK
jgi:hypothetical protein